LDKDHWTTPVKGIGSGYWRVVGEVEELIDKAKEMAQRTLFGVGFARTELFLPRQRLGGVGLQNGGSFWD
jgi:hypothetical protein